MVSAVTIMRGDTKRERLIEIYTDTDSLINRIIMAAMLRNDADFDRHIEMLLERADWVSTRGHVLGPKRPE
jgi:hypothetical protein